MLRPRISQTLNPHVTYVPNMQDSPHAIQECCPQTIRDLFLLYKSHFINTGTPQWVENLCPHKNLHGDVYSCFLYNCPNLEATKVSFSINDCGISIQRNMIQQWKRSDQASKRHEEIWRYITKWKKLIWKFCILYYFNYVTVWRRQIHRASKKKKISSCRGFGWVERDGWRGAARRMFRAVK